MKTILFFLAFSIVPFALSADFASGEEKSLSIGECIEIDNNQKLCYSGSVNGQTYAVNIVSEYIIKEHNRSRIYDSETYYLPKKVNNLNFRNLKLSYFNELELKLVRMW